MTRLNAFGRQPTLSLIVALAILLLLPSNMWAQATISTGNINGNVTDPSDAAIPGAKVTITRIDTGVSTTVTTNGGGFYNSGSILRRHLFREGRSQRIRDLRDARCSRADRQ